jgi:hypothetical protein
MYEERAIIFPLRPSASPHKILLRLKASARLAGRTLIRSKPKNNNKHGYAGANDCFTHLRIIMVLQAPQPNLWPNRTSVVDRRSCPPQLK